MKKTMTKIARGMAVGAMTATSMVGMGAISAGASTAPHVTKTPAQLSALSVARDAVAVAGSHNRTTVTAADLSYAVGTSSVTLPVQISDNLNSMNFDPNTARFVVRTDVNSTETVCVHFVGLGAAPKLKTCPTTDIVLGNGTLSDATAQAIAVTTGEMAVVLASTSPRAATSADVSYTAARANSTFWVGPKSKNLNLVHVLDNLGDTATPGLVRYAIRTGANTFSVRCVSIPAGVGGDVTSLTCPAS